MKTLSITSAEVLDARVAECCRSKIKFTGAKAEMEAAVAAVQRTYAPRLAVLVEEIEEREAEILDYCAAHRKELFPDKKSRETASAVIGFELTPPRVETANRKVTWKEVVRRLIGLPWGGAYLTQPEPKPAKDALLADRDRLTAEQLTAAGIRFEQDEQFFIRPKAETADDGVMDARG